MMEIFFRLYMHKQKFYPHNIFFQDVLRKVYIKSDFLKYNLSFFNEPWSSLHF